MRDFDESLYFKTLRDKNYSLIVCDEVGRGPIAGPVVSCSVEIPLESLQDELIESLTSIGVNDSKKVSEKKRQKILAAIGFTIEKINKNNIYKGEISNLPFYFVVKSKSAAQIDASNILKASLLSMKEGCEDLIGNAPKKGIILVDGNQTFSWPDSRFGVVSLIKGDLKSKTLGLASIIAKEYRDFLMKRLGQEHPEYGFESNAGYPTKNHKEAVKKYGPLPIHRKSFKGVKEFITQ